LLDSLLQEFQCNDAWYAGNLNLEVQSTVHLGVQ